MSLKWTLGFKQEQERDREREIMYHVGLLLLMKSTFNLLWKIHPQFKACISMIVSNKQG